MHYILPSREIICNSVEIMAQAHRLDGLVLLASCDKIVPAMLMAAARLDIPCIVCVGGPMLGGIEFDGRKSDLTSISEALGMLKAGKITECEYDCSGEHRLSRLRLLLLPGHRQHHVLRVRGSGHDPARRRSDPRRLRRPSAPLLRVRPCHRGAVQEGHHRPPDPHQGGHPQRHQGDHGHLRLHQRRAASARHRQRGGAGYERAGGVRGPHQDHTPDRQGQPRCQARDGGILPRRRHPPCRCSTWAACWIPPS